MSNSHASWTHLREKHGQVNRLENSSDFNYSFRLASSSTTAAFSRDDDSIMMAYPPQVHCGILAENSTVLRSVVKLSVFLVFFFSGFEMEMEALADKLEGGQTDYEQRPRDSIWRG